MITKYMHCSDCDNTFKLPKSTLQWKKSYNSNVKIKCPKCNSINTYFITKKTYESYKHKWL